MWVRIPPRAPIPFPIPFVESLAGLVLNGAMKVLGDETLRAHLRVLVKRILRKHGYPPDKQEKATRIVLEQAEILSAEWAA